MCGCFEYSLASSTFPTKILCTMNDRLLKASISECYTSVFYVHASMGRNVYAIICLMFRR